MSDLLNRLHSPDAAHDQRALCLEAASEIERLQLELGRAYRAVYGFNNAAAKGELPDMTMRGYHSLTVGAAARFVREGSLDGAEYFVGKSVEVLRAALVRPGTVSTDDNPPAA